MNVIALEASPAVASVALAVGSAASAPSDVIMLTRSRRAARELAPTIQKLLDRHDLTPNDLDLILIGLGPGGYTGTRLAVATARMLAFVLEIPILGVASTAALAAHSAVPPGTVLTVLDARKGDLYAALYRRGSDGRVRQLRAPRLRSAEDVAGDMPGDAFVVGDGYELLARCAGGSLAGKGDLFPSAQSVLSLGVDRYSRGERDPEQTLLPLYLRPSEAEILWDRRRDGARRDSHPERKV